MSESDVKFLLRLPLWLKRELSQAANDNNRSLNSELVHRLRKSVEGYRRTQ